MHDIYNFILTILVINVIIYSSFLIISKLSKKKECFAETASSKCQEFREKDSSNIQCEKGSYLSGIQFLGQNKATYSCCTPPEQKS